MIYSFTVEGRLPGMNDFISSARGQPWWAAANKKKKAVREVAYRIQYARIPKMKSPVTIKIVCIEANGRRDRDNVMAGASKVILDALTHLGIIKNDTRQWVRDIHYDTTQLDKDHPRVEVMIEPVMP